MVLLSVEVVPVLPLVAMVLAWPSLFEQCCFNNIWKKWLLNWLNTVEAQSSSASTMALQQSSPMETFRIQKDTRISRRAPMHFWSLLGWSGCHHGEPLDGEGSAGALASEAAKLCVKAKEKRKKSTRAPLFIIIFGLLNQKLKWRIWVIEWVSERLCSLWKYPNRSLPAKDCS